MSANWVLAGILLGPIIYIVTVFLSRSPINDREFNFGNRTQHPTDVLDSSIMYAVQVAAIALFATWGYMYGMISALVPVFWLLGYFVFSWFLSRRFVNRFITDIDFGTLHSFIADGNRARSVCMLAATLTLIGLAGPAMFEVFTVARLTATTSAPHAPSSLGVILGIGLLMVSVIYMLRGGFPGIVRIDQIQLAIGYGGFALFFALMIVVYGNAFPRTPLLFVSFSAFLLSLSVSGSKFVYDRQVNRYAKLTSVVRSYNTFDRALDWAAMTMPPVLLLAAFLYVYLSELGQPTSPISLVALYGTEVGFSSLALVSLFVANAFFQFVDITQWQRLLSISVDAKHLDATLHILRANVTLAGISSSAIWCIAVLFGVSLRYIVPDSDPYAVLQAFSTIVFNGEGTLFPVMMLSFFFSLTAIMFSTLDALASATSFTVQRDILNFRSHGSGALIAARSVTVLVIAMQFVFYQTLYSFTAGQVDAILYMCWSCQLALLPVVVSLLLSRPGAYLARFCSMSAGCLGAFWPLLSGATERTYEVSPWLSLAAAFVVYAGLGGYWRRRSEAVALAK